MRRFAQFVLLMAVLIGGASFSPAMAADPVPPLVSPQWLAKHAKDPGVVVLDARGDRAAFRAGRVPGAVYTDYDNDGWLETRNEIPGLLPTVDELEALIGSLGIDNDSYVIVVATGDNAADMGIATRIYWTFKVLGDDNVSILDGGMKGYMGAGGPIVAGVTESPTAKRFTAKFRPQLLATKKQVVKALKDGVTMIDNRPRAQYLGHDTAADVVRPGIIPSAKNVPAVAMTGADDGFFKDKAALQHLYAAAGVDPAVPAITYCSTGHWASIGWFVQSQILGNQNVRLYDGSLAEWSRDANLPMTIPADQ